MEDLEEIVRGGQQRVVYVSSAAYQTSDNPHYAIFDPYTPRFLGLKPIEFGTSEGLGWGGGLFGLNYVGMARIYVSWDESRKHGLLEGGVAAHEHKHNGPLFHGHNLAEYWNRLTDQPMERPARQKSPTAPRYELTYTF